jgi:hypothetical protein
MNHYVSFSLANRTSLSTCTLCTPPHCSKDAYTPQGSTRDLWTLGVTLTVRSYYMEKSQSYWVRRFQLGTTQRIYKLISNTKCTIKFIGQLFYLFIYLLFRIVFWDVLPCKTIVDRRFRGTCCLHHQGWEIRDELSSGMYCRVKRLSTDVSEVRAASIIRDERFLMNCLLGCTAV